ncbi:hypothetical protein EGW08_006276 [Elysia chlorotica]|uniref:Uncharacterized protein n=1 Tax=Elysia chlorotica TaxID=188477 RepID=A0A433TWN5_ELYCH|nr:hypothetical protein EGW08_006276 [Elysia chlorotica]
MDPDSDSVADMDPDSDSVADMDPDSDSVADIDPDSDSVADMDPDSDSVADMDPNSDSVASNDPDSISVAKLDPDSDAVPIEDPDSDAVAMRDPISVSVITVDPDSVSVADINSDIDFFAESLAIRRMRALADRTLRIFGCTVDSIIVEVADAVASIAEIDSPCVDSTDELIRVVAVDPAGGVEVTPNCDVVAGVDPYSVYVSNIDPDNDGVLNAVAVRNTVDNMDPDAVGDIDEDIDAVGDLDS